MGVEVRLRPFEQGEFAAAIEPEAEYDDFGPTAGFASPPPSRLDDQGNLAVEADGELVGMVSWVWQRWGPNHGSRNPIIGIWLLPHARGRGVGTAAQQRLVDLFFRHTPTNRVEAGTDPANLAEQRALERAGMSREGTARGAQWRDGGYRDVCTYAVLRADWTEGARPG
jgi:RimJ/RimL family protein N-acetyltransferase